MSVSIPPRAVRKLRRESASFEDRDPVRLLFAESVARRWFLRRRLPCWRTDRPPGSEGRYSLVFPSGRRALVCPRDGCVYSFDDMARAKCEYLLSARMEEETSGEVEGFFTLFDLRKPGNVLWVPRLEELRTRPVDAFPELSNLPGSFRLCYLLGSLRLLLAGEMKVPSPCGPSC